MRDSRSSKGVGGIEPNSAAFREVSCCGPGKATSGQKLPNSGRASWLATLADGKSRTEPGHALTSCGQMSALNQPQGIDPALAHMIEVRPGLSVEERALILDLARDSRC